VAKKTFDERTEEFLGAIKEGSEETYRSGLFQFQQYLVSLSDQCWKESSAPLQLFLDKVAEDQNLPARQRTRFTRTILRGFIVYLQGQKLKPKSVHTYVNAIQSLALYFEVEGVTTRFTNMPTAEAETKPFPWDIPTFEKFIKLLEKPMYQSIGSLYWQSGLSVSDEQRILYGGVKDEFEKEICPICLDFTTEGRHKTGVKFRSFFGPETIELIKRYFKEHGTPEAEDPLFPVTDRAIQKYFAVRAKVILGKFEGHNPMGEHTLRAKFRTNIVNAGCPESYAEYFMAHDLGDSKMEKKYTLMSNDQWREEYRKYMPALAFKLPKVII
jgi:integrase